jgi:hypothetical protein
MDFMVLKIILETNEGVMDKVYKQIFNTVAAGKVSPEGMAQFRDMVKDATTFDESIEENPKKAAAFLRALGRTSEEGKALMAQALAMPFTILTLSNAGQSKPVVDMLQTLDPQERMPAIMADSAMLGLAYSGKSKAVVDMLNEIEDSQQRSAALATRGTVLSLAESGKAKTVIDMICAFDDPQHRVDALVSDSAAYGLVHAGQLKAVINILPALDPVQRAMVLGEGRAAAALADKGETSTVMAMILDLNTEQRGMVLPHAIWYIADKGDAREVANFLGALEKPQRADCLAVGGVIRALAFRGEAKTVIGMMDDMDTSQERFDALRARYAISTLARNGEAQAVTRILDTFDPYSRATALSSSEAIPCLERGGEAAWLESRKEDVVLAKQMGRADFKWKQAFTARPG